MEDTTRKIDGYTMGGLGLNVGTSLIFEEWADNPKKVKTYKDKVSQFRVNVHTLMRNISEALEDEVRSVESVVKYATLELDLFENMVREFFPNVEIVYYVTEFNYYSSLIPRSEMRVSKSPRIRKLLELELSATGDFYDWLQDSGRNVERIKRKQGHIAKAALVLTHLPADLLCFRYYSDMFLVESHTGNIRERKTFPVKILPRHRRDDAHLIPFNHMSFQVYGDGGKMLNQASGAVTTAYTELARERKWNFTTSPDKIVNDINRSGNKKLIDWFAR